MDITSVHCLRELTMTLICAFSTPMESDFYKIDYPQYMSRSGVMYTADFVAILPYSGPLLVAKPTYVIPKNSPQREVVTAALEKEKAPPVVLASFVAAPRVGLAKLLKKKLLPGKLYTKADGNEQTDCLHKDSKMMSAIQKVRNHFGKPLIIESGYRSPSYNANLRKRSKKVAKHSMHMSCKAIDFRIAGVSMKTLRRYVRSLPEVGGVGLYASWVHLDTRQGQANW